MSSLVLGMKVRYLPQPEWGIGHLLSLAEVARTYGVETALISLVQFPAREGEPVWVSTKGKALQPSALAIGTPVRTAKGVPGKVTEEVEGGRGLRRYVLPLSNGETDELPESELRAEAPRPDALSMLKEARTGESRNFILRRSALLLDEERRGDALGALLASRVMVKRPDRTRLARERDRRKLSSGMIARLRGSTQKMSPASRLSAMGKMPAA